VAVVYLDPDDEITGAVARLRALPGGNVVIVLPAGSRIATSRMNFRLLAREARQRQLKLATVCDEPSVRAISVAAGVPAYESVDAAEAGLGVEQLALEAPEPPASKAAATPKPPAIDVSMEKTAEYVVPPTPAVGNLAPRSMPTSSQPVGHPAVEPPLYDAGDLAEGVQKRRRRLPRYFAPVAALLLLAVLVFLGGYAAYLFVPTATVTLQPKMTAVGPLTATVIADPTVAVVDASAGLVPATEISVPVVASDTFSATGTVVTLTAAGGRVRFSSQNTFVAVPVPAGTVVSTASGIDFETTESVTVPVANFNTQTPGTAMADVVAQQRGAKGNVPGNTIKRLPESLSNLLVSVRNPQPTTGGSRTEDSVVTQDDYEAAVAQLTAQLDPLLAAALADPATTPHGLTLYPATAQLGPAEPDQQASDLVDTHSATFDLQLTASGTVLAVNEELVDEVARTQLEALVPSGTTLLSATINTTHALGEVLGNTIRYNASGLAQSWRPPVGEDLVTQISGHSVTEARTIMEKYGSVEISIWPDFIDRLPDDNRIRLTIVPPQETP
jgi:hypothetical protein